MTRNSRIDIALSAEADVYIERTADTLAWEALRRKEYVALLEPKHQGKTSLINRLRYKCASTGDALVYVDLSTPALCSVEDESTWYWLLRREIARDLFPLDQHSHSILPSSGRTWYEFLCSLTEVSRASGKGFRTKLRQELTDRFNDDELRTLSFDLGIDYESLPALGKAGRAREIILYAERTEGIDKLVSQCRLLRPKASWTDTPFTAVLGSMVIAFDQIGSIPKDWQTSFFAAIRAVHQRCREQLTFVLAGAADPRDLIANPDISPFDVATAIALRDFTEHEVLHLLARRRDVKTAYALIPQLAKYLHAQTGGQPYLCQQLCHYLAESSDEVNAKAIDAAVVRLFRENPDHIDRLRKSLTAKPRLLDYLCGILRQETTFAPATNRYHFRLAHVIGILATDKPICQVRNRIYQRVLDEAMLCS